MTDIQGKNDIVWLTMRRLRLPLIIMILVFFASVLAMVAMPGVDEQGNPARMNYLDAAYFVAIMATTVGFGEIPFPFTDAQRMVVLALILPNVAAWFWSIGAIINLFMEAQFRQVLARNRFGRRVRALGDEPYHLVCGFGSTGITVVQGLLARGRRAVVIDSDEELVQKRALNADFAFTPMLGGDTTDSENLVLAGLGRENCQGVIITTNDDHANLTIAVSSKLLFPATPVFARSETQQVSDNMASFGTDYIINPYDIFAERLYLALSSPVKYMVQDWLITVPGKPIREKQLTPPTGRWVICGAGRFGEQVIRRLARDEIPFTVVDVHEERVQAHPGGVVGRGTEADTLEQAGIGDAAGIIACTGDDIDNLSIIMTARDLNPNLFQIARQENQSNDALFQQLGADLVAQRSLIVARRILAVATNPMLATFLDHLVHEDENFAKKVLARLNNTVDSFNTPKKAAPKTLLTRLVGKLQDEPVPKMPGKAAEAPKQWTVTLDTENAPGAIALIDEGMELTLSYLLHNTRSEFDESLHCVCLAIERGAQRIFLPSEATALEAGDKLFFAGWGSARHEMMWSLEDPVLLLNYATPGPAPRTSIGRWLWRRRQPASGRM